MSGARVTSIDALKHFRVALWKFGEASNVALGDAESEIQRVLMWLQTEQQQYWATQIRKRHEAVEKCKDAVRQKKLFKDSSGRQQSAVDEEKALAIAQRRLEVAEQKLINTRKHAQRVQKELHMYKGAVQRFSTSISSDLPNAVANLDNMVHSLEAYVGLRAPVNDAEATPPPVGAAVETSGGAMTRPEDEATPAEEEAVKEAELNQPPEKSEKADA